MDAQLLERRLDELLTRERAAPLSLRDALFEYWVVVSGAQLPAPLSREDEPALRRWLIRRLDLLWMGMDSTWESPVLEDLVRMRHRLEQLPEAQGRPDLAGVRRRLDALALIVVASHRLGQPPRLPRQWQLLRGGGETSAPRGALHVVQAALEV